MEQGTVGASPDLWASQTTSHGDPENCPAVTKFHQRSLSLYSKWTKRRTSTVGIVIYLCLAKELENGSDFTSSAINAKCCKEHLITLPEFTHGL